MRAGALLMLACLAAAIARGEDIVQTLGKQRAAKSPLGWDVREAVHPVLGSIRFAFLKAPVVTAVANNKVYSNVYVSCETSTRKVAIELANSIAPDDPSGLKPHTLPRLVCNDLAAPDDTRLVQDDITAHWEMNAIGDVLARGFSPFALRECVSIAIVQDVVLPKGWAKPDQPIEFEITPYTRELDQVFVSCGQQTAYAAPPPTPPAARTSTTLSTPAPRAADGAWKEARTTSRGRTNVRAKPAIDAGLVIELDPGEVILVQRTGGIWWRAKSRPNASQAFEGYIRQDRLVFK